MREMQHQGRRWKGQAVRPKPDGGKMSISSEKKLISSANKF